MEKEIPLEIAAKLIENGMQHERFQTLLLVQNEVLTRMLAALHQTRKIDALHLLESLRSDAQDEEMGKQAPVFVEVLQGRLQALLTAHAAE